MSAEENKRILQEMIQQVWNEGNHDKIDDYIAPDAVEHNPYGDVQGPEGIRQFVSAIHETYDDFRVVAHNIVAEDNFVAYNFTVGGEHTGAVGELEPTHTDVEVGGVYLARIEDGKIAEAWNHFDVMNLLRQLGEIPEQAFVTSRRQQVSSGETEETEERRGPSGRRPRA